MSAPTTDSKMYQTMQRQPADIQRLLDEGWGPAEEAASRLSHARRVFATGFGTSLHASTAPFRVWQRQQLAQRLAALRTCGQGTCQLLEQ